MKTGFIPARSVALALLVPLSFGAWGQSTLPDVVVVASRFAEKFEDSMPQTTIIKGSDIAQSGLTDVSQILQKLGNVPTRISLNGTQDMSIDLRGYGVNSDNNVVILLDGTRLSEIEGASARLSMIPVEVIDHIEIIRGGASVLYGEGATSGIINIVTKSQVGDVSAISAKVGSYGSGETNVFASRQWDATMVSVFGKTLDTENYRKNNSTQVRSGGASLQWKPAPESTLGVRLFSDQQYTRLPGSLTLAQFQQNPRQTNNPNDYGTTDGNSATIFGSTIYKNTEFKADLNFRNKNSNSTLPSLGGITTSSMEVVNFSPRARVHDVFLHGNDLSFGVDVSSWNRTYSSIYPAFPAFSTINEKLTQTSSAFYAMDNWMINSDNRLSFGGRLEQIKKEVSNFNTFSNPNSENALSAFEIQYTRSLNHKIQTYVRSSQGYRLPNIDDLRGSASGLLPQTSTDYEIGFVFQRGLASNATVRIFKSDIHNEIMYDPVQFVNINLPGTQRQGIEIEGNYQASDSVTVRGAWQKVNAIFVEGANSGKQVPLVPSFNAQAGIQWTLEPKKTLDASVRLVGQQYMDSDFSNTLDSIPFYWTADLRYSSRLTNRWAYVLAVNNLMDRRYYDYANNFGGYYPSPGINFAVQIKYQL